MKEERRNTLKQKIMDAAMETSTDGKQDGVEALETGQPAGPTRARRKTGTVEAVENSQPAATKGKATRSRKKADPPVGLETAGEPDPVVPVYGKQKTDMGIKSSKEKKQKQNKEVAREAKPKEKRSRKKALLALFIVLCCVFLSSGVIFAGRILSTMKGKDKEVYAQDASGNPVLRKTAGTESVGSGELITSSGDEQQRLNELAESSRVYCIISSSPYFKDSRSKGALYISNPKESEFYTQVIIKTVDDDREMYVSPLLAPDEKIEYDYLTSEGFGKGSYDANAYFNYYSKDGDTGTDADYTYLGSMCAEINVVID